LDSDRENPNNVVFSPNNHNVSFKQNGQVNFCFHLGLFVFAPFFNLLYEEGLQYIRQWLAAILLGSQNIEQSKEINYASLDKIIGKTNKTLRLQREALKRVSSKENTCRVLQFNAQILELSKQRDFYYDPHTKHYTGHLKVLSTWCPSVWLADKGINMDYIHTVSGYPVYFNSNDNFYDLRERFKKNIESFRTLVGFNKESILTYTIDRGIFSIEVFEDIIKDPSSHIITWEKGYQKNKWDQTRCYSKGSVAKTRNKSTDIKLLHYHYQENIWDKHPSMRQFIVRIFDKNWNVLIEVSILTDDKDRPAQEIIELMLKRWVQENDFKYMIKHFGINQLTSYAFTDYKELKDKIEDKVYTCSEHKAVTKKIQDARVKLKTALLRKYMFEEKHKGRISLPKREQARKETIWKNVRELNNLLINLEKDRANTTKQISKIEELIENDYKKLDTNAKDFMDAIKILARNIFYLTFLPFKKDYNNFRDDHLIFRHLTRSPGYIEYFQDLTKIKLSPQMEYQPKIKKCLGRLLNNINSLEPKIPDGSNRKIMLSLNI
jgi:hypothetical protein